MRKLLPVPLLFLFAFTASSAHAQFRVPPNLPVPGTAPATVAAAGDFNGDGMLDLAVGYSAPQAAGVAVFLRTGPSTFAPPVLSPGLPSRWKQVVAADLNLDGRTDLIVVVSGGVLRFVSDGLGGFTSIPMGFDIDGVYFTWSGIAYADVNGDGHADILTTEKEDYSPMFLNVSLGDGFGNFGPFTVVAPTGFFEVGQIAAGDLNGDGAADVVITKNYAAGGVAILLNDGSGTFTVSSFVPTGDDAAGVLLTDLDGDSKLDAAVANAGSRTLSILKGNGIGGLAVTASKPGPGNAKDVVAADFDGDGHLDLAVGGDGVWVYSGNGMGGFADPARYAASGGVWPIDLNGDGLLDLAAGGSELFNLGAGVLAAPRQFPAGAGVAAVAVGDMNGDGRPDVVTANADSNDVAVLLGNADGTFAAPKLAVAGSRPTFLALGDWNGDGRRDVAVANLLSRDVSILLGDGTGGLAPAGSLSFPGLDLQGLAAGDLNQDGRDDLVVSTVEPNSVTGGVAVFLASGNGSFNGGTQYALSGRPGEIALGSFNPDVRLDAAVSLNPLDPYTSHLFTLLGDGSGSLTPPQAQPVVNLTTSWIAIDDLNGDGNLDLVVGGLPLAGDGHGGFTPFPGPALLGTAKGVAIADFDGNGSHDLAFAAGDVRLAVGDGSGAFGLLNRTFPVGGSAAKLVTADFDGDGRPDLAVGIQDSDVVTVLRGEAMPAGADLSLAVTHTPDPTQSQGPLAVTVSVTNQGPLTAAAPVLTFQVPYGATFVSSSPGAPTCQTSQPSGMNALVTCSFPDLSLGGSATVTVNMTVESPGGTVLPFDTRVATYTPVDPDPLNNGTVHVVPVGSPPDLAVTLSDSTDPVSPGGSFDYVIDVTNVGGSDSQPGTNLVGTLNSVTYVSSSPPGICNGGIFLACNLPVLAPAASLQIAVTVVAGTFTFVSNSVNVQELLDTNPSNDSASEETRGAFGIQRELAHGGALTESFPAGTPAERLYYVQQQPHASYEVVVDATSGDVAGPGGTVSLQRLDLTLSPIQDAQAAGVGPSRTLHWENASDQAVDAEVVRVRSTGCSTGCGPGDAYRIRAYETTAQIPRFNTIGTQTTVLALENRTAAPVQGHAWLWDEDGVLVGTVPFSLGGHQTMTSNLAAVAPGRKGAVTISHDGPYGAIQGKGVAVEPATGFTFDTPLRYRPR